MARKNSNKLPPFVPMIWDMLNHEAYKKLPPSSAKALPYFLGKVKVSFHDPGKYTAEFAFSYPEAQKLGFAASTFHKVICDLVRFGFVDPVTKGGLKGNGRGYNMFKLSKRWKKYGTEDFRETEWGTFVKKS